ncbi:MAG: hypothetical protein FJX74_19525, partial [Armatimonadetes bacterium]|nr:hypothetical protein [Armatimonadota bacterium]
MAARCGGGSRGTALSKDQTSGLHLPEGDLHEDTRGGAGAPPGGLIMRAALILAAGIAAGSVRAADAITVDFAGAPDQPWLQLVGDATVEGGVLKTSPLAGWQRSGLYVGPLPVGEAPWHIEYDVRPVAYGDQCQEFVSVTPSTHWYMAYGRPDGRVNLHTRSQDEWKARSSSTAVLELGRWYRVSVELGATSIRLRIREREGQGDLWDSGDTPVDSLGQETVFGLIDEAATAVGATEWDNLVVSTDDPRIAEQMAQRMRDLEAERRAMEQRREDARKLREAGIALIPMPQQVALPAGGRGCRLSGTVQVGGGTEEQRGVVVAALAERLGLDAQSARTGGIIRLTGLPPDGPPELQGEQAYTLTVAEGRVEIGARAPVGVFYATQTLCQLADPQGNLPPVRLADWPAIENRLVMIAVCQGAFQVIDVEYWKRIIRELSAVKVTHIQVYFEGATFTSERYPFLGLKGPDGLTLEKGKTLSEYAKAHFIELLPQQNSLGHAGTILSHEELANLRESGDVFCSSKPETFEFLGNLYDELLQAFPYATWVHVGGDEFAHGFAQCPQCKQRAAEIGPEGLYAEHMMKLREMLAQRGRKMMIWWHEQGYTEQAADRLAKDLAVFDWHYGNQPSYPSLERLQNAGFAETWATPAITRYYDGSNDWDNTFGNVSGFLRAG